MNLLKFLPLASLVFATAADAELSISSPLDFQVIQRQHPARATIPISGTDAAEFQHAVLEARIVGEGASATWQKLNPTYDNASFHAALEAPAGGWYRLEIKFTQDGKTLTERTVEHVGVGEIFLVAGQSNSANHGAEKQQLQSGMVVNFDGKQWRPATDPQPGASGGGGSFIPPLGDALAAKFKVPVGFITCGIGATSVREWLPKGSTFPNPPTITSRVQQLPDGTWESKGDAFANLVARLKPMGPNGIRAVLWHQGESDANQKDASRTLPGKLYQEYLAKVIKESRTTVGWTPPWFVAQVSYHVPGDESSPDIRAAQAALWNDGTVFQGPDSDAIKGNLRENNGQGVHFSGPGLREHAARWMEKISPWLEAQLKPKTDS